MKAVKTNNSSRNISLLTVLCIIVGLVSVLLAIIIQIENEYFSYNNNQLLFEIVNQKNNIIILIQEKIEFFIEYWLPIINEYVYIWKIALYDAFNDSIIAIKSCTNFIYITLYPLCYCIYNILYVVGYIIYEYILIRGLFSPQAIKQMKLVGRTIIQWQLSLSPKQLVIEFGIILSIIAIQQLLKFLKRRQYMRRIKLWRRRKQRAIGQIYYKQLQRLATVSVFLAIMTPHVIFASGVIALKLFIPNLCLWIAMETQLINTFYYLYPLIASICLLFDYWCAEWKIKTSTNTLTTTTTTLNDKNFNYKSSNNNKLEKEKKSRTSRTSERRTKTSKKRRKSLIEAIRPEENDDENDNSNNNNNNNNNKSFNERLEKRQKYWLDYWIVCSFILALKKFIHVIPLAARILTSHPIIESTCAQLEWLFWIWLIFVPILTPNILLENEQYMHPIDKLKQIITYIVSNVDNAVSNVVPETVWIQYIVSIFAKFSYPLVYMKVITQEKADIILHLIQEGRSLIVPIVLVFSWPLQSYAILYVSYILPLAKSVIAPIATLDDAANNNNSKRNKIHWLQVWVFHTIITFILSMVQDILWWIPFSNIAIFILYASLAVAPKNTINAYYIHYIQEELQACCILPFIEHQSVVTVDNSKIARGIHWMISKLPSAVDEDENNNDVNEEVDNNNNTIDARIVEVPTQEQSSSSSNESPTKTTTTTTIVVDDDDDDNNNETTIATKKQIKKDGKENQNIDTDDTTTLMGGETHIDTDDDANKHKTTRRRTSKRLAQSTKTTPQKERRAPRQTM